MSPLFAALLRHRWTIGAGVAAFFGALLVSRTVSDSGGLPGGEIPPAPLAEDRRARAVRLIQSYVPSETGDAKFAEISKDYGGIGTTCGYLTGWLLWRLGAKDNRIVNREQAADGLKYHVAENISRLVGGAKALGAWRTLADGLPKPGDMAYYATNPPPGPPPAGWNWHEHVNVVLDAGPDEWRTADGGRTVNGHQAAEIVTRKRVGSDKLDYLGGPRSIIGWVDLDAVPLEAPPTGPFALDVA